jgi:hypothetical protein
MDPTQYLIMNKIKRVLNWKNIITSLVIGLILAAVITNLAGAVGPYDYYRTVTINSTWVYGSSQTDFPILINETIADLATVANGGDIQNTVSTGGASGSLTVPADFRVTSDGTCDTVLDYEFEDYDETTGAVILWVEIPELSGSVDTVIYLCYGDASTTTNGEDVAGTWNSGYAGVWHMDSVVIDSTGNGNDGTDFATFGDSVGKVGRALAFDGNDDYWRIDDSPSLDITGEITLSAWVKFSSLSGNIDALLSKHATNGYDMLMLPSWGTDTNSYLGNADHRSNDSINDHSWGTTNFHMLTFNYNDSENRYQWYHDGIGDGSQSTSATLVTNNSYLKFGMEDPFSDRDFYGRLDEIRISNVERHSQWILTEYESINNSGFLTVGAENAAPGPTSTPTQTATPTNTPIPPTATNTPTPTNTPTATNTPTPTLTPTPTPPGIVMANEAITLPTGLKAAIETALNTYRPDSELGLPNPDMSNMWAITSYAETEVNDYYWVSVAGFIVPDPGDTAAWDLSYTLWAGVAIAYDNGGGSFTAHMPGSTGYPLMLDAAGLTDINYSDAGGSGSPGYWFPWANGFVAYYGDSAVHGVGHGYGGLGYHAVDFVGGTVGYSSNIFPNGVYAASTGKVVWRCEDAVQVWVQIGDFVYGHLVDNPTLVEGAYHSQGSYIGALVTGTHLTPSRAGTCGTYEVEPGVHCGYMCQQTTSYHLHFGFKPIGDYFTMEQWTLHINDHKWYKGIESRGPGQYLLSNWGSGDPVPTPGPTVTPGGPTLTPTAYNDNWETEGGGGGGNLWDSFIAGMLRAVQGRVDELNEASGTTQHEPRQYVQLMVSGIRIMIRTFYVLLRSNLDLRITVLVIFMIAIMEPLRLLGAAYMWIKEKIPFVG